jgi:hypothetical protein
MLKVALAGAAAAAFLCLGPISTRATADEWRHHHHHWYAPHVWGSGHYDIVRWSYGDCKIWHDDDGAPWGDNWWVARYGLYNYEHAWYKLGRLQARGVCS